MLPTSLRGWGLSEGGGGAPSKKVGAQGICEEGMGVQRSNRG